VANRRVSGPSRDKVMSISGDGGSRFPADKLETAVRLGCNLAHSCGIKGTYDMVRMRGVSGMEVRAR